MTKNRQNIVFRQKKSLKELLKKIEQETCQVFLCETSFSPLSEIQEDRKINLKLLKFFLSKLHFSWTTSIYECKNKFQIELLYIQMEQLLAKGFLRVLEYLSESRVCLSESD